jgi:hypothetical protein
VCHYRDYQNSPAAPFAALVIVGKMLDRPTAGDSQHDITDRHSEQLYQKSRI